MSSTEASKKLKDALSSAPSIKVKDGKVEVKAPDVPKIRVKDGKIEVETPDGQTEEASEINLHKFA